MRGIPFSGERSSLLAVGKQVAFGLCEPPRVRGSLFIRRARRTKKKERPDKSFIRPLAELIQLVLLRSLCIFYFFFNSLLGILRLLLTQPQVLERLTNTLV